MAFADVCTNDKVTYFNQGDYDNTIAVDPVNPDVVWAGGIDLFRSDDGGRNWGIASFWQAAAPQLSHADNHGIVFAPGYNGADNQTLFAISDGGIYRTDNARADTAAGPWQMVNMQVAVTAGNTYLIEVSATGESAGDGGFTILAAGIE